MEINSKTNRVVGIDIGGSHITVGLVDLDTHQLVPDSVVRRKVDSKGNAKDILAVWKSTIESMEGWRDHLYKISIAMPGPFDYQNGISWLKDQGKYQALYGLDIRAGLAEVLGMEEDAIDFENDAACFLQGEVFAGAARGVDSAIGLTLGTGLGSSKYHGGFAEDAALWSSPFKEGTVEDYLSTRWFIQAYYKKTGDKIKEVKDLISGSFDLELTQDIFKEFSINLSLFLKQFVQNEKPEVIILGGNISKAEAFFISTLKAELAEYGIQIPIKITQLGEEAILIGAASSWNQRQGSSLGSP